jgi:choloylglycine hydrolase
LKKILIILFLIVFLTLQNISIGCTGFTASEGDMVLFGNNEDWNDPDPYIRVHPAEQNKHGRLYIEFGWPPDNPRFYVSFTGINDQGLCFDSFLHPYLRPTQSLHKPSFNGDLMEYCIETCSTVDELLEIFDMYNLEFMDDFQYFVVDRFGDSAIIEGDEVIHRQGRYQVVTNFLQSDPGHGWYPCWRYDTAVSMVEDMEELTVEYFTEICEATHQEGAYPTVYSYVNDLKYNLMYLYHYYDYEKVVILDINEEISQGEHSYYLPDLFAGEENQPPLTPSRPDGPSSGRINRLYTFSASTTDPDDDRIFYMFDWGDGTNSGWLGPIDSGEIIQADHTWISQGTFEIRVKARDINGEISEWSEPSSTTMPRNKITNRPLLQFLANHPNIMPILQYLLQRFIKL